MKVAWSNIDHQEGLKAHQKCYPALVTHLFLQIPEIRMLLLGTFFDPFVDIFKCLSAVEKANDAS